MRLFSPAKCNCFLQIRGRRSDGYHDLATLMQTLDWGDWITFTPSESDTLRVSNSNCPTCRTNLIWKAADLFRRETQIDYPLEIDLEKSLPLEAGLGGGSSNAATTLWALNEMTGRPVSLRQLQEWGGRLGADVPFFLSCGTALCTGIGEQVEEVTDSPERSVWVVKPSDSLSTPAVYNRLDLSTISPGDPHLWVDAFRMGELPLFNDLEEPAFLLLPRLRRVKQCLVDAGCGPVLLAGSGSSLICFGPTPPPVLPETICRRAHFLRRSSRQWYSPKPVG